MRIPEISIYPEVHKIEFFFFAFKWLGNTNILLQIYEKLSQLLQTFVKYFILVQLNLNGI